MRAAYSEAEHRSQRRISNGITGLIWMVVASVVVSVITAIAVALLIASSLLATASARATQALDIATARSISRLRHFAEVRATGWRYNGRRAGGY